MEPGDIIYLVLAAIVGIISLRKQNKQAKGKLPQNQPEEQAQRPQQQQYRPRPLQQIPQTQQEQKTEEELKAEAYTRMKEEIIRRNRPLITNDELDAIGKQIESYETIHDKYDTYDPKEIASSIEYQDDKTFHEAFVQFEEREKKRLEEERVAAQNSFSLRDAVIYSEILRPKYLD